MAIFIGAVIVGFVIGLFLPGGFLNADTASPKTFEKEDFKITLTDDFSGTDQEGMFAYYASESAIVFAIREDKTLFQDTAFQDIALETYGEMVLDANNRTGEVINKGEEFVWIEYTDAPEGQEIYYFVACYEGENAFWIVNFLTPASNQAEYRDIFMQWAASVDVGVAN